MQDLVEWKLKPTLVPPATGHGYIGSCHVVSVTPQLAGNHRGRWQVYLHLGLAREKPRRHADSLKAATDLANRLASEWLAKAGLKVAA